MDLNIREANIRDAVLVSALAAATFYEAYVEFDEPQDLAEYVTSSFAPDSTEKELSDPSNTFLLAELDRRAVGYAKLRRGSAPDFLMSENLAEIQRIYILSKFARKGVGAGLIAKCCERAAAEGYAGVFLGVWDENLAAKAFYESQGFTLRGETDFHYGNGVFVNEVLVKVF